MHTLHLQEEKKHSFYNLLWCAKTHYVDSLLEAALYEGGQGVRDGVAGLQDGALAASAIFLVLGGIGDPG